MILNLILKKEIRKLLIKKNGKLYGAVGQKMLVVQLFGQIVGPQGDGPELYPIKWETLQEKEGTEIRQISPVSDTEGFKWEYEEGYDQTSIDAEQHRIKVYDDSVKVDTVTLKIVTVILLVQILPLIFQIQRLKFLRRLSMHMEIILVTMKTRQVE